MSERRRVLIAGVGNVLRGDDGFGVKALEAVKKGEFGLDPDIHFYESGIAGIGLVQQLLDGYDALIILDALDRRESPGTVFVLEPDVEALSVSEASHAPVDLHETTPESVVKMAAALRALPRRVWIVGCQAQSCDDLDTELSEAVERALPTVVDRVQDILRRLIRPSSGSVHVGT